MRPLRLLVSAALAVGSLTVPAITAAAAAPPPEMPPPTNVAADEPSARTQAVRSGKRIEVQSATTETVRVFANPSGTLTAEISAMPQRVRRAGNTWVDVDTSLRVVGGMLRPNATVSPMAFSAGGAGPLARLSADGGNVAYTWDGPLPTPVIEGDTAVYPNVYPDVDLRVRALVDGFSYALVVKTHAAATHPALRKVKLGVTGERLTVSARPGGGFVAKTKGGKAAVMAGGALMWDQRGASIVEIPASERERALMGVEESISERVLKAKDVLAEPADHARKSSLAATFASGVLTVYTDLSLLQDPKAVFPVVIDPPSQTIPGAGAPHWGFASSDNENRTDGIARVGPDPDEYSSVWRSFFGFPVTATIGGQATITGAAFQTWLVHSGACQAKPVNLYGVSDFSAGRSNWPGAALEVNLGERSGNANKSACPQPDMFMEWKDDNVKNYVQSKLTAGASLHNFGLAIANVNGENLWKKYDPNRTALWVEWNKKPTTPVTSDMAMAADATSADIPCVGTPWVRGRTPALRAALRDPDNEQGGQLTGTFTWQRWDGAAWQAGGAPTKTAPPATPTAPGNRAEIVLPQLTENVKYRWQLTVSDSGSLVSDPSPWCEFLVASQPLTAKPTVSSTDFPTTGVNGAVGQSGKFNFGANGLSSVASYTYWLEGGPARTVSPAAQGGSVSGVIVTPTAIGQNSLHVMSRDTAGNSSEEFVYKFSVNGEQLPVSHWKMNDNLTDTGTTPQPTTVNGSPVWTVGRFGGAADGDRAIVFDGVDDFAKVSSAVLDHGKALTMSAWMKLPSAPADSGTLLSSGTGTEGVFELRYLTSGGWCFTGIFVNGGTRQPADACSGMNVKVNEWTHVMGVYDPSAAQQLAVYVNGVRAGHTLLNAAFETAAELNIGAAERGGVAGSFFRGDVSEVRVWRQALTPVQLQIADDLKPKSPAQWDLNDFQLDPNATTAADESDHHNTLTFNGDATFDTEFIDPETEERDLCSDSYNYSGAVRFGKTGTAGSISSAGPILDSSASFSAAAFVCVANGQSSRQVVMAQRGSNADGFAVYYDAGVWKVEMADGNIAAGAVTTAAHTGSVPGQEWHHVAVVFDAAARKLTVYVDGVAGTPVTMNAAFQPWRASGPFVVGSGLAAGDWLAGTVDSVRLYSHALTAAQVGQLNNDGVPTYSSNHVPGPPTAVTIAGLSGPVVSITDTTPDFAATFSDSDSDQLWFQVSLTSGATSAETTALTKAVPGTQTLAWPTVTSPDWPAALTMGVVYSYKVRAYDGVVYGPWSSPIDVIVPKPNAVNYPPVPAAVVNSKYVKVTLTPAAGDAGFVAGYRYGVDPTNLVSSVLTAADGKAELQFAPTVPTTVYFQAVMADGLPNPAKGDGKPNLSKVDMAALTGVPVAEDYDVEGDGRGDMTGLIDVSGVSMPYLMSTIGNGGAASPVLPMGSLSYPTAVTEHGVGDFDGDKRADIAVLTEAAGALKLKVLRYNGVGFTEVDTGFVPQPGMNADRTKLMVGDVNGDGKDDVTIAFETMSLQWGLWVSLGNGTGSFFAPSASWYLTPQGASDYRQIKWFMGDFDKDGKADVGEFYNYAGCQTIFWAHKSSGSSFPGGANKWDSGAGNWCQDRSIITTPDLDGIGGDDLAVAYRYDNCEMRVFRFMNTPDAAQPAGFSTGGFDNLLLGPGWCGDKIETAVAADFQGDWTGDVRFVYRCCGANQVQIWTVEGYFGMLTGPMLAWQGGIGPIGTGNMAIPEWTPVQIVAKSTGRCLAMPDGTLGNTIQVQALSCQPEHSQSFDISHIGRPQDHRISFRHSGKCLNVRGAAIDNGTPIDQYDCQYPQQNNEAWQIRYVSGAQDPLAEIVSVASGKCLQVPVSLPRWIFEHKATLNDCTGSDGQRFYVRKVTVTPSAPIGWWKMNDAAGSTTLADSSAYNRPATLMGGGTVGSGAASFNGTSAYGETVGSVLNTGKSWTVSAWVKLTGANNFRTAVSQDGTNVPGFELGVKPNGTGASWQVERANQDTAPPTAWAVAADSALATTGTWVHLVAVYDAPAGQLRLYRNRILVSTVACNYTWNAGGKFAIGRALGGDFWPGDIDDVRVWNRVLGDTEIYANKGRV